MECVIDKYFCLIVDRLEFSLFGTGDEARLEHNQPQQPSLVTRANVIYHDFVNELELQTFFGLLFNILLLAILFVYVPRNFTMCWSCSSSITVWIGIMSFLSTLVIIPKIIILRKLLWIEEESDQSRVNLHLWTFLRCKAFKFNSKVDRVILGTYLVGVLLFKWITISTNECENLLGLVAFLLICFLLTIVLSFWKLLESLTSSLKFENIIRFLKKTFKRDVQALELIKYKEYQRRFALRSDDTCSICYEIYTEENVLRIMKCSGAHAYHKECIDKWLNKSERCPQCNLSALKKGEAQIQAPNLNQEYMA